MRRLYGRLIEWLADVMVSENFVTLFFGTIGAWIAWNSSAPNALRFDDSPYMGLNLVMSALAGIQASAVAIAARKAESLADARQAEIEHRHDEHERRILALEERVLAKLDEIDARLSTAIMRT